MVNGYIVIDGVKAERDIDFDDKDKNLLLPKSIDHKQYWFSDLDLDVPLAKKEAFLLSDPVIREDFRSRYTGTAGLYFRGQQDFDEMLLAIQVKLRNL